ncbi:unnamed protein product [Rhodiola kirilowii]
MAVRDFGRFFWQNLRRFSADAFEPVVNVARFFCVLHITNSYLVTPALAEGPSMLPTINLTGDFILAEKISVRLGKVRSGDIVLIRSSQNPRKIIAKRVMAMEGQRVSFVANPSESELCETIVVPKGHVWIEGDNIYASTDSRKFGPVPYGLIHGRIFWRVGYFDLWLFGLAAAVFTSFYWVSLFYVRWTWFLIISYDVAFSCFCSDALPVFD